MSCDFHQRRTDEQPGYYSSCAEKVITYIKDLGFKVNVYAFDLPVSGRIYYTKSKIAINCPCSGCALLTLLHEAGHLADFLANGDNEQPSHEEGELLADKLGREISDKLGFELDEEWEEFVKY